MSELDEKCVNQPLRVIQVTDMHLHKGANSTLLAMNTQKSFDHVLKQIRLDVPVYDLVLVTGDISQDASPEAYERAYTKLETLNAPHYWIPGNHDDFSVMKETMAGRGVIEKIIDAGSWQIIMLNSTVHQKVYGHFTEDELASLDQLLKDNPHKHTMICFHHHPVEMTCRWMKNIGIHNVDDFFAVIDKYTHVKAVIWGHVHQSLETERKGVPFICTPSTCIQFKPDQENFTLEDINPGYRYLELYDDGSLKTHVARVEGMTFEVDFTIRGY